MRKIFGIIVIGIVILFFAQTVEAATYYVSTTGNDSNLGTITSPFRTIAKGLTSLSAGNILYIRGGTYIENILSPQLISMSGSSYANAPIIQAYTGETVTLHGQIGIYSPGIGKAVHYIIFKNLTVDGQYANHPGVTIGGGGSGGTVDHIKLDGLEVKNIDSYTAIGLGGDDGVGTDNWVVNAKIHDGRYTAMIPFTAHGFYIESSNNIVENSEIYNMTGYGVHVYAQGSNSPSNNKIMNNFIHNNGNTNIQNAWGILLGVGIGNIAYNNLVINNMNGITADPNNFVYNNTVYGNGVGYGSNPCCYEAIRVGSGTIVKNNIVFGNQINSIFGDTASNNFLSDPKFTSTTDFHLQSTSGAINYGVVLSEFTTDKDGNTRVGNYDAGAYEYVSGTPSSLLGDINNDRIVNSLDWSLMSSKWLTNDTNADLNKDGAVNSLDWSIMSSNWLKTI